MSFKRSIIGVAVAVVAFAGMATGAGAVIVNPGPGDGASGSPIGTILNGESALFGRDVAGGTGVAIEDQWDFTIGGSSQSSIFVDLTNVNTLDPAGTVFNILGLTLELFAGTAPGVLNLGVPIGTIGPVASTSPPSPSSSGILTQIGGLSPGNYYFQITGTTSGSDGGQYDVQIRATPLPAAIWLLMSALLGLVSFSRIRRSSSEAA